MASRKEQTAGDRRGQPAKRTRIGLLVETSLGSGRMILRGVTRFARTCGQWSLAYEPRSLTELPEWLAACDADGIIARCHNSQIAKALSGLDIPVVDVLGVIRLDSIPLVHVDNQAISRIAAEHLLQRGFGSFGFYHLEGLRWSEERAEAFKAALSAEDLPCSVFRARPDASPSRVECAELAEWIVQLPKPVGIMVCSDWRGHALVEACRLAGAGVPDQVAIVSVDNDETLCEACDPPLTSVIADHERVGFEAAALLDRIMRSPELPVPDKTLIEPLGIEVRRSSDVTAIHDPVVAKAMYFIRENACMNITPVEVVKHVCVSRSVLQRKVKKLTGRTIQNHILSARLEQAQFLLRESAMPISEVALKCAFRHQEYFGSVFRRSFGITPGAYRKRAQHA